MTHSLAAPAAPRLGKGETRRMTFDEFWALPDDIGRAEWVEGAAYVFEPSSTDHQELIGTLALLLSTYAQVLELGEVILSPFVMAARPGRSYREPDLLFVSSDRRHLMTHALLDGPADLVVEIISDDSVGRDRRDKLTEYEAIGVRECWIFDPRPDKHEAEFHRLDADGRFVRIEPDADGRIRSSVLPGFWLRPEWFWQEPLPVWRELFEQIAPGVLRVGHDAIERFRRGVGPA